MRAVVLTIMVCVFQTETFAQTTSNPCFTAPQQKTTIAEVNTKKQTFKIAGSDQNYALAGVEIRKPDAIWNVGTNISLSASAKQADRYGVVHVQAFQNTHKAWLQGKLLQTGSALLNGSSENLSQDCLTIMRRAEHAAISSKAGLWAQEDALFNANQVAELATRTGYFTVVEGNVVSIGDRKRRLYLNFGQNWSQDFTLSVVKKGKGAFKGSLNLLKGLKGKTIRVRGILEQRQGPLIRLFDEAQIEVIDE